MSEKRRGLFNRVFSPNGENVDEEEPSEEQVRRWLNEPDGRPSYRPPRPSPSGSSSMPTGLGGGGQQQQAFRDLAAGFGRSQPGRFDPAPYTPPTPDQWNPHKPSGGGASPTPPSGGYSPPQQGEWTPPQRWTPPQPGGWAPQNLDDDEEGGGVEVGDVGAGGPLAEAGVRAGDVIVAVDGRDVDDEQDLFDALGSLMPGRSATLEIIRGDSRMTTVVVAPR
jgi:hypothetical protein